MVTLLNKFLPFTVNFVTFKYIFSYLDPVYCADSLFLTFGLDAALVNKLIPVLTFRPMYSFRNSQLAIN